MQGISIHALLAESDCLGLLGWLRVLISIHALLAESDLKLLPERLSNALISIHALLAESDQYVYVWYTILVNFYPRSPCGERLNGLRHRWASFYFYPRSPCGERLVTVGLLMYSLYFYPRSPCGERHLRVVDGSKSSIISIHALLAESDQDTVSTRDRPKEFLSTLSLRRATHQQGCHQDCQKFLSTLSLRRATLAPKQNPTQQRNFYPRSPCGERLFRLIPSLLALLFLSTLSLRRATPD